MYTALKQEICSSFNVPVTCCPDVYALGFMSSQFTNLWFLSLSDVFISQNCGQLFQRAESTASESKCSWPEDRECQKLPRRGKAHFSSSLVLESRLNPWCDLSPCAYHWHPFNTQQQCGLRDLSERLMGERGLRRQCSVLPSRRGPGARHTVQTSAMFAFT